MNVYGLIGKKISHSFSPEYFNSKFKKENIDAVYKLFPLEEVSQISELIAQNPDIKGLNVTVPFKSDVVSCIDTIESEALEIEAVNCIDIRNHKLYGYNTDSSAFAKTLLPFVSKVNRALILGSGGSSKAIAFALDKLNMKYTVVSRKPVESQLAYRDVNLNEFQLLVNTTPLGMIPLENEIPALNLGMIDHNHIVYDLNYNPTPTKFMNECKKRGALVKDGLEMLYLQADLSWDIWKENVN